VEIEPTVFIVVAVFVFTILGVAFGLKTRKGSGINEHPGPASEEPGPASQDPEIEGSDQDLTEDERPDSTLLDQHGKK